MAAEPPGFRNGPIQGVVVRELAVHRDKRGSLIETFRRDTLPEGLDPAMSYVSFTGPDTARGPHEHLEQTDLFAFTGPGSFQVVLWDNRVTSHTFGNRMRFTGGEDSPVLVVVPPGVVHGYRNASSTEQGMVLNFPDRLYRGWGKTGEVDEVRHEDAGDAFFRDFQQDVQP